MIKKTVFYFVPAKALIKFKEDDESLIIVDAVMTSENLAKDSLKNGDVVEVEIGEVEIKTGKKEQRVIKLQRVKEETTEEKPKETKKAEDKKETKSESESETVTKEILCVSKYGLKFVNEDNWINFSDELQNQNPKQMGAIAKNTITATIVDGKIASFFTVEVTKPQESKEQNKPEQNTKKSEPYESTTNNSIERQVALKESGAIIRSLIEIKDERVNTDEKIMNLIKTLTKVCLDAVRQ
jgi:hypothetical protein